MMVVIFMLPGAEEMCLLFAHDGCHFYASKSLLELYYIFAHHGCHFYASESFIYIYKKKFNKLKVWIQLLTVS